MATASDITIISEGLNTLGKDVCEKQKIIIKKAEQGRKFMNNNDDDDDDDDDDDETTMFDDLQSWDLHLFTFQTPILTTLKKIKRHKINSRNFTYDGLTFSSSNFIFEEVKDEIWKHNGRSCFSIQD
jgi:hypothetical protein